MRRLLTRAPLRLVLVVPFVVQVAAAVGLTAWLSIRNGQQAVNQVTHQLRQETTARISYQIRNLLLTAQIVNNLSVETIRRESLDLSNIRSVEDLYWDYINAFETIQGLGLGNSSGHILAMFQRLEEGETRYVLEYSNAESEGKYISLQLNNQRQVARSSTIDRAVDARERPWYKAAVAAEGLVWTEVYTSVSAMEGHSLAINVAQPVYGSDGQIQGVASVILNLGQISQLLDAIAFSPSGQIYIVEASGNLVGSSDGNNPVVVDGEGINRLPAVESESALIRASAVYLNTTLEGGFGSVNGPLQLNFKLDGERQFLQITPIQVDGLRWFVVVVAPESDFMEQIYANTRNTIWLCLGAFALATGVSIVTARQITNPLLQLNQAAKDIARGNLDRGKNRVGAISPHTREVGELADSFSQMTEQLQSSFGQLRNLNAELANSESRLKQFLDALPVGASVYDATGQMTYLNQVGKRLLGICDIPNTGVEQLAEIFQVYRAGTQVPYPVAEMPIARSLRDETTYIDDVELHRGDRVIPLEVWGAPIVDEQGEVIFAIAAFQDISDRKQVEAQLIHNALHDALTQLPNRSLLMNRLELAIQRAQQFDTYQFAVLFLDLDQFKIINDSLGHLVGDQLLVHLAHRLQALVRPLDLAARLGGDEFMILLDAIDNVQVAIQIAERILAEFEGTTLVDGHTIFVTTSIGIVWGTSAYTEASDLLRDADIALYRAKAQGRARYEVFNADMHIQAVKRMTLEQDLRSALDQQEFALHYQPIVDLNSRQVLGFEALVRWQHPVRGFVSPADFIPVAEETGLILPISRWVLEAACAQLATWQQQFPAAQNLRVSVNLSGKDLLQTTLVETIQQTLAQTQLSATALTLEITESMLVNDVETTIERLRQLRELGISISIDDFGTGYSSLSYLYNLPANYLKIDQSFVGNMQLGDKNYKIVQAVVALSDQLQLAAIAEGIETEQQMQWLKALNCELGQGYRLSRPLTPAAATTLLASGLTLPLG
ncbi:hypothetical protein C8255_15310 [filamentous cyanobacterium CCP3]|nr:hypothetical protein C8255_15310 [filamentous cyanobacterium CCP3]